MEVALFHRQRKTPTSTPLKSIKDLSKMLPADQFLAEHKRQMLLDKIERYSGLESARYSSLCTTLLHNLVHYCQSLPETANSYYSQSGGLADHALNRTEAALGLFQEFIIQEQSNILSEEQKLWQYALFSAAVLQGIGKLFIDYQINLFDAQGHLLKPWNPLAESLITTGSYYDYEFLKDSDIAFRRRLNLLMARAMMPTSGFTWIASNPEVLAIWLALLNEDQRSAGTLGALLVRADAMAIQRYFNELMLRRAARGGHHGRKGAFSGVVPESIAEKDLAVGAEFIQWLYNALDKGVIMINQAPLMMVPGGLLMCQEMFQLFAREHPEFKNWQAAQSGFIALGLHQLAADGGIMSRFEQTHNQQIHHGIVLGEFAVVLPTSVTVHNLHNGVNERMPATEFIHRSQNNSHFVAQNHASLGGLQKLSAGGQWMSVAQESMGLSAGAKGGV